jgi:hypothetical protein
LKKYRAFESPIPALKTSIASLIYKCRHHRQTTDTTTQQEELEEDIVLKCKFENCQDINLEDSSSNVRRRNMGSQKGAIECSFVSQTNDFKKE